MVSSIMGVRRIGKALFIITLITITFPLSGVLQNLYVHAGNVIYEKETFYNHLDVVDRDSLRTLYLNGLPHGAMYLNGSNNLVFPYTRLFHLAYAFNPNFKEVLFVGGGSFSGPKSFLESYPHVRIDVVEIDSDVIRVAQEYFNIKPNSRLQIFNDDARNFLRNSEKKYDVIVLDAYSKTYIPFHLMTKEFFFLLYDRLAPNGVIVSNIIASLVGDTSNILRAQYKTLQSLFPKVYLFPVSSEISRVQNVMVVALKEILIREEELNSLLSNSNIPYRNELKKYLNNVYQFQHTAANLEDIPILTDDYAPVENLINPITGKPYSPQDEANMNQSLEINYNSPIAFSILISVALVWGINLFEYSKRN